MFYTEGPIQRNDRGVLVGPIVIAKDEGNDVYATALMGEGWHEMKLYEFGTHYAPDLTIDLGWISAREVRAAAMRAEVGIVWG